MKLATQKIVFLGAGSAGCGIAEQISQMEAEGLSETQARSKIYMVGRYGLLTNKVDGLRDFQQKSVQDDISIKNWQYSGEYPTLSDVINYAKPDVLIGVSGQAGLFTESIIRNMKKHCDLPIILPLSNPSRQIEATQQQVIEWTEGHVIIATGSPFKPLEYKGKKYNIVQCNNNYIFPGIGLAVISANITRITDEMLMLASETLAADSPIANVGARNLLSPLTEIASLSKK